MRYTSELITVTYSGDLAPLYYHALSIDKFWKGDKVWTIVIEDQTIYQRVIDWVANNITPNMPGWTIKTVTGPKLVSVDGWHRQQILKLWAASESLADYSVILDCKNFLIKDFSLDDLFVDNKLKVNTFHRKDGEAIDPTHIEACRILGVESASEVFPITPFVWRNSIVRDLLVKLNSVNYDILTQPTIKASEAALYWVFAQDKEAWVDTNENWAHGQYGGVTKDTRLTSAELAEQFKRADDEGAFMITMHRFHTTPANAEILGEYLRTKGIVGDWKIAFFRETFKECLYRMRPEVVDILHTEWEMPPLKSFTRNGQSIKFNRVVAYGCSHTAGSELADHLFWEKPITAIELDKIKRSYANPEKFYNKYTALGYQDIIEAQNKMSWAGKVAEKLGVPILNRGLPGSSMQGIIYSIERDRFDGRITDNDLILIGATSMDRWMYFEKEERFGWPHPATPIFGWPNRWPSEQFYNEFVAHVLNDYFTFFNYFTALRYFDLMNKEYEGRVLVQFIHHTMNDYAKFVTDEKLNKRFMSMVTDVRNFSSIVDQDLCLGGLVNWNDPTQVHGFSHPHEEFHEQLATKFVDKLLNNE